MSPDGSYKNEIDYIITNHPKVFTDTNIITKLNFNTNHRMVRSSLKKAPEKLPRKHIRVNVRNELRIPYKQGKTNYQGITKQINETTNQIQKYEILEKHLTNCCTQAKKVNNKSIAEISKKIRESIRKDRKTKPLKTLELQIQKTGGTKKALKELREAGKQWIPKLKRKEKPITNRRNINELATHFFTQVYANQKKNTLKYTKNTHNLITPETETDPVPEFLLCEVEKAIKSQKLDKSPGPDNITNELLKGTMVEQTPLLTNTYNNILTSGSIPKQWEKSHIILIHKRGDKEDIENYRPISLMSNVYKVFAEIILDRMSPMLDEQQPVEQAGFRRSLSTIDHIRTVKQILEKYNEYKKKVYIVFIDYAKAFNSLNHSYIWNTLEHQGILASYINIIKKMYVHSQASIQLETLGKDFPIKKRSPSRRPLITKTVHSSS
ncbi:Probable RNA-directed DNA polymerase from transposon BS [Eumeta japonica]|uniref:Probable RNA-directed DNA polymerase from transposon BS n=1 Tax=Eumeta variegata TaxID=151549 RepID=A0A4C1WQE4_EUMVA|nr:Probable RNA-directed DNA polymerase from transposon BS [Eumeta japonica]